MTLEQAIDRYTNNAEYERIHGSLQGCLDFRQLAEWLKDYKRLLEQEPYICDTCKHKGDGWDTEPCDGCCGNHSGYEPCEDIAQERYKDLCEYFGGAKDILNNREDFKAWLGRIKWHIRKAEELYEKYEYKKEPCAAISREAAINIASLHCLTIDETVKALEQLPSVTQKSGKWIKTTDRLPEDKTYVLTTIKVPNRVAHARSGWYQGGFFHNDNGDTWNSTDREVIAWMPLPKPYEPQEKQCVDCNHYGKLSLDCSRCDDDCSMFEPQESEDKE